LSHNTLENYYKSNFSLAQHHKYSIAELENLMVFERDLYMDLLIAHLKEQEDRQQVLQG
jgi:hypothetical protein